MATRFVAKDGSDSNGGTSYADAFLTIGAALSIAVQGDTIMIGPGVYNETVVRVFTTGSALPLVFQGDGYVILDGGNVLLNGLFMATSGLFTNTFTFNDLIVQNYVTSGINVTAGGFTNTGIITRCIIRDCGTGIIATGAGGSTIITDCLIYNCLSNGISLTGTGTTPAVIRRCTIADCTNGLSRTTATSSLSFRHCILAFNDRHYNLTITTGTLLINYNDVYFDGSADALFGATTETTLSGWQTTSGQDANSISVDPIFLDREHRNYNLQVTSPIFGALVEFGVASGAGFMNNPSVGMSENDPDGNFAGKILSNTVVNSIADVELGVAASTGTVRTPVIDIGSVKIISVNIDTTVDLIKYPSNVPDFSTSDTFPKRMTYRYRGSTTSFVNADASPAFTEVEPNGTAGEAISTPARFVQVEVTLRSDGS